MFRTATFLTFISQLQYTISDYHTCVPNKQFYLNGLLCTCDALGRWSDASCLRINRRQNCQPGQVIWQGCSQCICQENGQLLCNIVNCDDRSFITTTKRDGLLSIGARCTPFRIYYVDCNICVCPSSGVTANAHCAKDTACSVFKPPVHSDLLASLNKNFCLPKVMYLFNCLSCLCSDEGYFALDKCVETCQSNTNKTEPQKCKPKSFYRKDCNVCFCPENMIPNDKYCTQNTCNVTDTYKELHSLRSKPNGCIPYHFTLPRCLYCDCNSDGTINERACLEVNCVKFNRLEYKDNKDACNPGELVPLCVECLCFRNGSTHREYCTKGCSNENKVQILDKVFKNNKDDNLFDIHFLEKNTVTQSCKPNSIYAYGGDAFCLCPENGITDQKSCIVRAKKTFDFSNPASEFIFKENNLKINFSATCEPSTFVQFECNSCFCSKNGTIDPKWCTYDDCEAKKRTQAALKDLMAKEELSSNCTPGSITKHDCNYCICPENGQIRDKACTRIACTGVHHNVGEKFQCEPLEYYEVDCNICLCPRDGRKNVEKCTKNLCEKNFLRSDTCISGKLFSDECNVCVCPPNGKKTDKVCTTHNCQASAKAWKSIYKLSNNIMNNQISEATTRKLDLCFPGEEFSVGCHLCVCPEMGIRSYATCTNMLCDENKDGIKDDKNNSTDLQQNKTIDPSEVVNSELSARKSNHRDLDGCWIYNISDSAERQVCTPGSMYIIRCRQCICPYMGNINNFCRPLRPDQYCEQAYPGVNFLPMGRRRVKNYTRDGLSVTRKIPLQTHNHTFYKCDQPGRVMDKCFICECEEDKIVKEHCFRNYITECEGEEPSFLKDNKLVVL